MPTLLNHKQLLLEKLSAMEASYDPLVKLLEAPFSSPGYHTTLKDVPVVHPTRESLAYAVALLDSGLPQAEEQAFGIIAQIISLQDTDRSSPTFGIWSWFYEEPLDQMAPPDLNWADFLGKRLLLVELRHHDRLPKEIVHNIRQSVCNACDAIIQRNVGPDYTNIAIMGAFVTLLAGELYGIDAYLAYGFKRLKRFYDYSKRYDSFEEYNCPTYTTVAIIELSCLYTESKHPEARKLAAELIDLAWKTVAEHYHPRTKQWSGPHGRAYKSLLTDSTLSFLQCATDGRIAFLPQKEMQYDLDWYGSGIHCPDHYLHFFTESGERYLYCIVYHDGQQGIQKTATTALTDDWSIGTFNKEVMWNQKHNMLAYIGNGTETTYFRVRFLHDGYDYSSAVFTSVQHLDTVLFGINFAIDGGDTHINLDRIEGSIQAYDLRLRFELGGEMEKVWVEDTRMEAERLAIIHIGEHSILLRPLFAVFGSEAIQYEITRNGEQLFLDWVLYKGEAKRLDFRQMEQAALLYAFRLGQGISGFESDFQTEVSETSVSTMYVAGDKRLSLSLPLKPDKLNDLFVNL
jgi:hypothetical protein